MLRSEYIVPVLLEWFRKTGRDLPWRRTTDPYGIWISEVMLQQTQVATVIPYWQRWMQALPDVERLAAAPLDQVLKLWEGLGYYTRARNLHRAAQVIAGQHRGVFPRDFEDVLGLPGIGRYTAGAICSIAFNQPTPIVDGNVTRVLARVDGIGGPVRSGRTKARLWAIAQELIAVAATGDKSHPRACSDFNQALMELGAVICIPKLPKCPECPLVSVCIARRIGRVGRLPNLGKRPQAIQRRFVAFVAFGSGRVLVRQRPAGVVNAHLWEFPNVEVNGSSASLDELAAQCLGGGPAQLSKLICTVKHSITRSRIQLEAYRVNVASPRKLGRKAGVWRTPAELDELAFPSAHRKILKAIET